MNESYFVQSVSSHEFDLWINWWNGNFPSSSFMFHNTVNRKWMEILFPRMSHTSLSLTFSSIFPSNFNVIFTFSLFLNVWVFWWQAMMVSWSSHIALSKCEIQGSNLASVFYIFACQKRMSIDPMKGIPKHRQQVKASVFSNAFWDLISPLQNEMEEYIGSCPFIRITAVASSPTETH